MCWIQRFFATVFVSIVIINNVYANSKHIDESTDAVKSCLSDKYKPIFAASGGVTDTEVTLVAGFTRKSNTLMTSLDETPCYVNVYVFPSGLQATGLVDSSSMIIVKTPLDTTDLVARTTIQALQPSTNYTYVFSTKSADSVIQGLIKSELSEEDAIVGGFKTPHEPGNAYNLKLAFGSCARTGSSHPVFDAIADQQPDYFFHMGDLHYMNIEQNSPALYATGYKEAMSASSQKHLYTTCPISYMWDDHDFGPNNSDGTNPGSPAAASMYRKFIPHHRLPADDSTAEDVDLCETEEEWKQCQSSIEKYEEALTHIRHKNRAVYHSFHLGRAYFIVTDLRSQRLPNKLPDCPCKSILGKPQLEWFLHTLKEKSDSSEVDVIVWVNTFPWIWDKKKWGWFSFEREKIANFIQENNIAHKLVMISGDAHMIAVDDGSHSMGGFPVFHAASFDHVGSIKGGPYSHGAFPGHGQFGILEFKWIDNKLDVHKQWSDLRSNRGSLGKFKRTLHWAQSKWYSVWNFITRPFKTLTSPGTPQASSSNEQVHTTNLLSNSSVCMIVHGMRLHDNNLGLEELVRYDTCEPWRSSPRTSLPVPVFLDAPFRYMHIKLKQTIVHLVMTYRSFLSTTEFEAHDAQPLTEFQDYLDWKRVWYRFYATNEQYARFALQLVAMGAALLVVLIIRSIIHKGITMLVQWISKRWLNDPELNSSTTPVSDLYLNMPSSDTTDQVESQPSQSNVRRRKNRVKG